MQTWLDAFTEIVRESGLALEQARLSAEDAIVDIEESVILSRILGNKSAFNRILEGLPDFLTKRWVQTIGRFNPRIPMNEELKYKSNLSKQVG